MRNYEWGPHTSWSKNRHRGLARRCGTAVEDPNDADGTLLLAPRGDKMI